MLTASHLKTTAEPNIETSCIRCTWGKGQSAEQRRAAPLVELSVRWSRNQIKLLNSVYCTSRPRAANRTLSREEQRMRASFQMVCSVECRHFEAPANEITRSEASLSATKDYSAPVTERFSYCRDAHPVTKQRAARCYIDNSTWRCSSVRPVASQITAQPSLYTCHSQHRAVVCNSATSDTRLGNRKPVLSHQISPDQFSVLNFILKRHLPL
jgi:hypothetical protein